MPKHGTASREVPDTSDVLRKIMSWSRKLTPGEFDLAVMNEFNRDYTMLERILDTAVEPLFRLVEADPLSLAYARSIQGLMEDLEHDGVLPPSSIDVFSLPTARAMARSQASIAVRPESEFLDSDHIRAFPRLAKMYAHMYETIIAEKIRPLAEVILSRRPPRSKARILEIVRTYKSAKYQQLFEPFRSEVRNSIQHEDSLINNRRPEVTFMDEGAPVATWSLSDFRGLCYRMLQWSAAFDYVLFKRRESMLRRIVPKLRKLQRFVEKSDIRPMRKSGGSSLVDIADSLPDPDEPTSKDR